MLICMLANYLSWHLRRAGRRCASPTNTRPTAATTPSAKPNAPPKPRPKPPPAAPAMAGPRTAFCPAQPPVHLTRNTCRVTGQTATIDMLADPPHPTSSVRTARHHRPADTDVANNKTHPNHADPGQRPNNNHPRNFRDISHVMIITAARRLGPNERDTAALDGRRAARSERRNRLASGRVHSRHLR